MRCPLRVCLHSRHSQEKYKIDIVYYMYSYVHTYISIYRSIYFHIDIYTCIQQNNQQFRGNWHQQIVSFSTLQPNSEHQIWFHHASQPSLHYQYRSFTREKMNLKKTDDEFAHGEMSQKASTFWYLLCHQGLLYIMFSIQTTWLGAFSYLDTSMSSPS